MRKDILVIGIVLLIGGVILIGMSRIRETEFAARSINDDELRTHLEAGEYHVHASNFVPESYPPKIKIYDSYGNLVYEEILVQEKNYELKSEFEVHIDGIYRIKVNNVQDDNGVLEVSRIMYPFNNFSFLGIPLIALGIAFTVVGIIKPYKKQGSVEVK